MMSKCFLNRPAVDYGWFWSQTYPTSQKDVEKYEWGGNMGELLFWRNEKIQRFCFRYVTEPARGPNSQQYKRLWNIASTPVKNWGFQKEGLPSFCLREARTAAKGTITMEIECGIKTWLWDVATANFSFHCWRISKVLIYLYGNASLRIKEVILLSVETVWWQRAAISSQTEAYKSEIGCVGAAKYVLIS